MLHPTTREDSKPAAPQFLRMARLVTQPAFIVVDAPAAFTLLLNCALTLGLHRAAHQARNEAVEQVLDQTWWVVGDPGTAVVRADSETETARRLEVVAGAIGGVGPSPASAARSTRSGTPLRAP